MIRTLAPLSLACVLLAGCAIGPNYKRPNAHAPAAFRGVQGAAEQASFADLPWFDAFHDEILRQLIATTLANNYDLRIAITRVEQARAASIAARSPLFPQFGYGFDADRGQNTSFGTPFPGLKTGNTFLGAVNAAWEVDLWGRIRRLDEAGRAQLLASNEARRGVVVTLVSGVAQAYYELLELDLQLEIARKTTESFSGSLKLFQQRLEGGVSSKLDTSRARASLASTAAAIPQLQRLIILKEDEICILLGQNPGPINRSKTLLQQSTPPQIPLGLPSTLLERRPDVRQAEDQLRAANADIGVALADFFPRIGLTALYGGASTDLGQIARSSSKAWSVGADVSGPIFQGGRIYAEYLQAKAFREQAKLQYQQTALNAFREVADALAARQKLEEVRVQQALAVTSYEEAVSISQERYTAGKANYYEVLEAQQELFTAQNSLAQTQRDQLLAVVQLYRALGGGWNTNEPATASPR
jgi:multidrug efflux system outer membrane protein